MTWKTYLDSLHERCTKCIFYCNGTYCKLKKYTVVDRITCSSYIKDKHKAQRI